MKIYLLLSTVSTKIRMAIATQFRVPYNKLYLTRPTFFSKMTKKPAKTLHDEYWHVHVDKVQLYTYTVTHLAVSSPSCNAFRPQHVCLYL